jgi:hypothetical protein
MMAADSATLSTPAVYQFFVQSQTSAGIERAAHQKPAPALHSKAWKRIIARNLAAIASLETGWDGPNSRAISKNLIYRADRLLRDALEGTTTAVAPYIIPRADGALQIEWATQAFELEFAITEDGQKSFWLCNRSSGIELEEWGDAATEQLFRWAGRMAPQVGNGRNVPVETQSETIEVVA